MARLEHLPLPKPLKYFVQLKVAYECRPHWQPTKAQKAIASVEGFCEWRSSSDERMVSGWSSDRVL
jgi:hypothetical protein